MSRLGGFTGGPPSVGTCPHAPIERPMKDSAVDVVANFGNEKFLGLVVFDVHHGVIEVHVVQCTASAVPLYNIFEHISSR